MIPQDELDRLTAAVAEAEALASEGAAPQGYLLLLSGFRAARTQRDEGKPWGDLLVQRWQEVFDRYAQKHEVGTA